MKDHADALSGDEFALLRGSNLLEGLTFEALSLLLANCRVQQYPGREVLYKPGQTADQFFMVLNGKVQIYRGEAAGKHAVLSIVLPGDCFGLAAALELGPQDTTAETVGISRLAQIPASDLRNHLINDGALGLGVARVLSNHLNTAFQQLERIQLKSTGQRLADFLLGLVPEHADTAGFSLPYEKALIAYYLGMEPESLSRALKELKGLGVTNRGRRVEIDNVAGLRRFAKCSSDNSHPA